MLRIVRHGGEVCVSREVRKRTPKDRVTKESVVVVTTTQKTEAVCDICYTINVGLQVNDPSASLLQTMLPGFNIDEEK